MPERDLWRRRQVSEVEPLHRPAVGLVLVVAVAALLFAALVALPRGLQPLPAIARQAMEISLPAWHLTEPVNEIVYGSRGFDTFGETFLLMAAVVSVVVLARAKEPRSGYLGEEVAGRHEQEETDPARGADPSEQEARRAERGEQEDLGPRTPDAEPLGSPAPERAEGMTVVIRTGVRAALPLLAVAGAYLVAWGYSPGGGFPGGAVALGVALLAYAAFGYPRIKKVVRPTVLELAEQGGALGIIAIQALGLLLAGSVSANWLPLTDPQTIRSGGVAQLFSVGELLEVGTGLTIVVFALIGMGHEWSPDEAGEDES